METVGTIVTLEPKNEWWYRSCTKCCALVITENNYLKCTRCDKNVEVALPRFKTFVKVQDDYGGEAILILWDPQAKSIIGRSAKETT
ncbi:unnamed protein product [Amaranthus hypochondriacus]